MRTLQKKTEKKNPAKRTVVPKDGEHSFFDSVYAIVRKVPRGRVTTYGAVAEATGIRMSARMVGWALNVCSNAKPKVPAHRVVNRLGVLSGRLHFPTLTLMQELLEQEGIKIVDHTVVDFKRLYWEPPKPKQHGIK